MLIKKFILTSAGILFLMITSFAQEADPYLSKFFVAQVDETVYMRWTITAGNTCDDTYIERSDDGVSYERIGLIGGICGSPDQPVTYDFTDTLPLVNRTSYYRLQLGYLGYSSPESIEFKKFNEKGYFLGPNPFSDQTRFTFENKDALEYRLLLINLSGNLVLDMKTRGQELILFGAGLASGLYYFQIFIEQEVFATGKLIKK